MRVAHRSHLLLAILAVVVGVLGTSGVNVAEAASHSSLTLVGRHVSTAGCNYFYADAYWGNGDWAGYALWSQDPCGSDPGDALAAADTNADGVGINAHLETGRKATTAGHNAPYTSPWVTGNLPEDNEYLMWACTTVGGDELGCSNKIYVTS